MKRWEMLERKDVDGYIQEMMPIMTKNSISYFYYLHIICSMIVVDIDIHRIQYPTTGRQYHFNPRGCIHSYPLVYFRVRILPIGRMFTLLFLFMSVEETRLSGSAARRSLK